MLIGLAAVLYLGVSNVRQNTQALLSNLANSKMDAVVKRIDAQLQPVEQQLEYLAATLADADFELQDQAALGLLMQGALAATPQVMGLLFLEKNQDPRWVDRESQQARINTWYAYRSKILVPYLMQPPERLLWLPPVWSPHLNQRVLPLINPVYRGQQFVGLLVAVIAIDQIADFIASLSAQLDVKLFILYDRDQVLVSPGAQLKKPSSLDNEERALPLLAQTDDPVLKQFWNGQRRVFGPQLGETRAFSLNLAQQRVIYLAQELDRYGERPWTLGAYLAAEQLPQEIQKVWTVLLVGLVILGGFLLLVVVLSRRIGGVVERTVAGFDAIGQQPLAQIVALPGSRIQEFDRVAHAYNRMLDQLRQNEAGQQLFGQYVPQAVARELLSHQGTLQPKLCEATVLFCDLEGFTRLSQELEPGRLVEVLNEYFSLVVEVIEAHNGVVTQFQGDAVLATFNVPLADPDHALQAWSSALEIVQRMRKQQFCGHTLCCRIGINTGALVAGSVGARKRLSYTVHGDAVNLAARLEALNKLYGTRILISEFSAKLLPGEALRFVAETEVRGRQGRVKLYTALTTVTETDPIECCHQR
ncbi:MAG: adenylate/guanylate cyclase domain-containing protein [Motiliproteus sp.]